jgi:hypothetical protein
VVFGSDGSGYDGLAQVLKKMLLYLLACTATKESGTDDSVDPSACFQEPPTAEIGTGEYSFEELTEGQDIQMQHGSQGGEHILGSLRLWNMDPVVVIHYYILREDTSDNISDQTFRVQMLPEGECQYVYAGMYGYLGFIAELVGDANPVGHNVILHMEAEDTGGRSASAQITLYVAPSEPPQ